MTASATCPTSGAGRCRGQLLVVDADAGVRDSLQVALECEGFAVSAVETGLAAVHRYAAGLFDLVLLDVGHPESGGWDLLARLRSVNPQVGVVVMTVRTDLRSSAISAGVLAVCEKPCAVAALISVLLQLLRDRELGSREGAVSSSPVYVAAA